MDTVNILTHLKNGGIILYPTDTLYGLGCDVHNNLALEKISQLKKRPGEKLFSLTVANISMMSRYIIITQEIEKIVQKYTPGKITIIGKRNPQLDNSILPGYNTIGIRIPDDPIALHITTDLDRAITATSANLSGQNTEKTPRLIIEQIDINNDYNIMVIDDDIRNGEASTIIDCSDTPFKIIRSGAVNINV